VFIITEKRTDVIDMNLAQTPATQESLSLISEEGVVERIVDRAAVVLIQKSSCCAQCSSRGACDVLNDKEMRVEVLNELQAGIGDRVEISMPTRSLLTLSLMVYFFPVVALVVGATAGSVWAGFLGLQPPVASMVCGAGAMGMTFYVLKRFDRFAQTRRQYSPRMRRILTRSQTPPFDDSI
jgi:sigma-E factor negative regulatory protein RseC